MLIFSNLGSGDSTSPYSAYSIFNKGCRYLLGEARADILDKQIRGGGGVAEREEEPREGEYRNFPSKYINRPCPCGSGLKAKKCHANRKPGIGSSSRSVEKNEDYDFTGFEVVRQ